MHPKKFFSVAPFLFFVVALMMTATLTASAKPNPKPNPKPKSKGVLPPVLSGVQLTDQHGKLIRPASFGNGPLLLNFIFTHCSAACPIQVKELLAVHRALPADVRDKVQFLSVSVDPANDTPQALANFAKQLGADVAGWRFATGNPAQIAQLLERMQVMNPTKSQPQPADHRLTLYLFNPAGIPVISYVGAPVDKQRLIEELTQLARLSN